MLFRSPRDPLIEVVRITRDVVNYYVKRYTGAGKHMRRYLGRPRIKAGWQNLKQFDKWGIPTAEVVAWGLERNGLAFGRGAMITRELPHTEDLSALAERNDARLADRAWVGHVSSQLARHTRVMHQHHFAHNDRKWRNLLARSEECRVGHECRTRWSAHRYKKKQEQ